MFVDDRSELRVAAAILAIVLWTADSTASPATIPVPRLAPAHSTAEFAARNV